ncbi:hypothetical protein GBA52_008826 [Prunus armeniaca]|nr:hypothetical protein GBA52_008826 [Prunus armeniaca]
MGTRIFLTEEVIFSYLAQKPLPPEVLQDCNSETFGGGTIRIPMVETYVRCLNLSVSVGIALYEASRQLSYEQLQFPNENCIDHEQSFVAEDIFA